MSGGTGLTSNDFSFTVNGSGPQPSLTPTTSMPPTVVPPTPLPPTQQPGGCTVDYTIQNQWNSGATVSVTIGNGSSSAINGWTLAWTFPGNQQINQMWGGSYTQSGANVSVSNVSWNSTIPANGTAGFGFGLTYSGTNTIPTNFALNGVPCNGSTPPPTQVPPTSIPPTSIPPTSIPPTSVPPTSVPPTSIPPTTVPPTTVPPTQQPGTCSVDYVIQNDWGSGATVTVTVRNGSSSAINGWTLTWTFPGNQQITNLWNGSYTQSGASVSVRDAGWNATIGANGGTVSFGFNLNYNGTNGTPTNFALNGTACQ
ncbi:MAG: cellulose binding domain-containing protein [Anaerolineae bacterium]|nr:cellulose binding domain-containing protein [Anaerolineae bacterium]